MRRRNSITDTSIRKLFFPGVFIAISLILLIAIFFVITVRLTELRKTPTDNVTWSLSQVEVDALKLEQAAQLAISGQTKDFDTLRRRFDNLYSRSNSLQQSPLFAAMRADAAFHSELQNLLTGMNAGTRIIDLPNEELQAQLSAVRDLASNVVDGARQLSLRGIELTAFVSDRERGSLASLLTVVEIITGSVIFVFLGIFIYMLRQAQEAGEVTEEAFQANSRLKSTFDVSLDAIIVADTEGNILEFNSAAEDVFQFTAEEAVGQEMSELIVPEQYRKAHRAGMKRFRETNKPVLVGQGRIEITALRKNGEEFPIEISIGQAQDDRGTIFISYVRDITERVEAQKALTQARDEALQAEEAKSNFLAVMSHEMRTPLNGVFGAIDLLKATKINKEQARYLDIAQQSGDILLGHVDSVLDVTRLDAGVMDLVYDPIDVEQFFKDIISANAPDAAKKSNKLTLTLGQLETGFIEADKQRVRQVVYNLLGNALKFTENGTIKVYAAIVREDDATYLTFSVQDTGIGIPASEHGRIFERFYTQEKSYDRQASGAGLGLAICKQVLDIMEGSITIDSTVGLGTVFRVRLPVKVLSATTAHVPDEGQIDRLSRLDGMRVLLAEDNEINRLIVRQMLETSGAHVTEAHDGAQAVSAALRDKFSVVLMDISMPVLNGLDATKQIRAGHGPNTDIPILALTAHALDEEQEPIAAAGLQAGLRKPISRVELVETLAALHKDTTRDLSPLDADLPPILNDEIVQDLRDVFDAERLESMFNKLDREIDDMFAFARIVPQRTSGAEIAKVVHNCIGSSGLMGALRLQAALRSLEGAAKADVDSDLQPNLEAAEEAWADTKAILHAALMQKSYPKG